MFHAQGGVGGYADGSGQVQRRDAVLRLGDQIDAQKPELQRQLGAGEDGPLDHRGLKAAAMALVNLSAPDLAACAVTASWALKALGPSHPEQSLPALVFCAILREKFRQTESFLKLNRALGHGALLTVKV